MKFKHLQENLRKVMMDRIHAKELTGLKLAHLTGFQQAHISNFLNSKRSLSMEGLDRVLTVQHLSVLDLLDPKEVNKRASIMPPSEGEFEDVLLVEGRVAAGGPMVTNEDIKEILKFKKTFLKKLRPYSIGMRDDWRRFVMVKVDHHDGMSMYPRLLPDSTVLIDRHYNALVPYRKGERNMYAVKKDGGCTIKYLEQVDNQLVLRPHNQEYPVSVITAEESKTVNDYIVGRVAHVSIEV